MNHLPKVAFLIPSLGLGGAELQLIQLMPHLTAYYDVHLFVLSNDVHLLKQASLPPEKVFQFNGRYPYVKGTSLWYGMLQAWSLSNKLRDHDIRLLVAHLPLAHWVGRLATWLANYRSLSLRLITYHHSIYPSTSGLGATLLSGLFRFTSRIDHQSVSISQAVANSLFRVCQPKDTCVIFNFVMDDRTDKISPLNRSYLQVVLAGRVEPVKGQVFFFQSIMRTLTHADISKRSIHFWVVGDGSDLVKLKKMTGDNKWSDLITFTGAVDHTRLLNFLANADLIVIPSMQEGLGNVAIESLMYQRTILASNAGGLPEVVIHDKTGFVFNAGQESSLVEEFCRVIDHRLSISAEVQKQFFKERFTLSTHISNLRQCFDSILRHG